MTLISVIIPAYNAAKFLPQCLDSVLGQDFAHWEAIVVDDGSTDSTAEIARRYAAADSRIKVFSKENGGISDARNFGLVKAAGDWITFLDSDDCLYPHSLSALFAASQGVDMVVGKLFKGVAQGNPKKASSHLYFNSEQALISALYQKKIDTSACGKLFKAEVARSVKFHEERRYEDLEYMVKLLNARDLRVRVVNETVYFYRTNPSSFINTFHPGRLDVLKVTEELDDMLKDTPAAAAARERRLSANFNIFSLLCAYDKKGEFARHKDDCWNYIRAGRLSCLRDRNTRLRSKTGALLSYLGRPLFSRIAAIIYRGR